MSDVIKVLLVDDHVDVRQKLKRLLTAAGRLLFEADTEETAIQLIQDHDFDVIFLDVMLPFGVKGFDVLKKAKTIRPDLGSVIILTGLPEPSVKEEAALLGAGYLDKAPFDRRRILEEFDKALTRRRAAK
jgi:CheY-like chemotaxis protein